MYNKYAPENLNLKLSDGGRSIAVATNASRPLFFGITGVVRNGAVRFCSGDALRLLWIDPEQQHQMSLVLVLCGGSETLNV